MNHKEAKINLFAAEKTILNKFEESKANFAKFDLPKNHDMGFLEIFLNLYKNIESSTELITNILDTPSKHTGFFWNKWDDDRLYDPPIIGGGSDYKYAFTHMAQDRCFRKNNKAFLSMIGLADFGFMKDGKIIFSTKLIENEGVEQEIDFNLISNNSNLNIHFYNFGNGFAFEEFSIEKHAKKLKDINPYRVTKQNIAEIIQNDLPELNSQYFSFSHIISYYYEDSVQKEDYNIEFSWNLEKITNKKINNLNSEKTINLVIELSKQDYETLIKNNIDGEINYNTIKDLIGQKEIELKAWKRNKFKEYGFSINNINTKNEVKMNEVLDTINKYK